MQVSKSQYGNAKMNSLSLLYYLLCLYIFEFQTIYYQSWCPHSIYIIL